MWTFVLIVVSLAAVVVAVPMARNRGRSTRLWLWVAFLIGPLAPLALLIRGNARRPARAT